METPEKKIERSQLWIKIYDIVAEIPRKEVNYDSSDALSVTTEIEKLFNGESITDDEIAKAAVIQSNHLPANEQSLYVAGFQEAFKWMKMVNNLTIVRTNENNQHSKTGNS